MSDTPPFGNRQDLPEEQSAREARHQVLIDLLGAYADRELPAETTSQIDAHLVGCGRCRRELAVHQAIRLRLGVEPPVAAPPALRDRISAAIATTPLAAPSAPEVATTRPWWRASRRTQIVAGMVLIVAALAFGIILAVRIDESAASQPVARLETAATAVPLLADVLADYRRVTAGDLPGRARDLDLVQSAVPFPVEPLRGPDIRLLAVWTTDLGGEAAAVLAYRWDDRIILEYLVAEARFFRHPAVRTAVGGGRALTSSSGAQGLVAWPTLNAGAVLVGDVAPERLAHLAAADLLAKSVRRGAK